MKQFVSLTLIAALSAMPVVAQDETSPQPDEGFSLMEEGARMLLRGLMTEVEPAIEGLRDSFAEIGPEFAEFMQTIGPAFAELLDQVDDVRNYEAPEFLPNGDIIIRRSPDAPAWQPDPDTGEIEL